MEETTATSFTKFIQQHRRDYDDVVVQTSEYEATLMFMLMFIFDLNAIWLYGRSNERWREISFVNRNLPPPMPDNSEFKSLMQKAYDYDTPHSSQSEKPLQQDYYAAQAFAAIPVEYNEAKKIFVICKRQLMTRERVRQEYIFTAYQLNDYKFVIDTFLQAHEKNRLLTKKQEIAEIGVLTTAMANDIKRLSHLLALKLGEIRGSIDDLNGLLFEIERERGVALADHEIGRAREFVRDLDASLYPAQKLTTALHAKVETLHEFAKSDLEETVDIHRVLDKALAAMERRLKAVAQVFRDFDRASLPVYCSPNKLLEVFVMLLENAADAMANPGRIAIKTAHDNRTCTVMIKDDGLGIAKEDLPKIFRPDFSTKDKGMGLGLYISQKYIQQLEGSIAVDSIPNKGTLVTVKLPLVRKQSP